MPSLKEDIETTRNTLKRIHHDYTMDLMTILGRYANLLTDLRDENPSPPRPVYTDEFPDRRIVYEPARFSSLRVTAGRKPWNNQEIERLINLYNAGKKPKEIMNSLPGRSETAIECKLKQLKRVGSHSQFIR
jgi:hypothetical protein